MMRNMTTIITTNMLAFGKEYRFVSVVSVISLQFTRNFYKENREGWGVHSDNLKYINGVRVSIQQPIPAQTLCPHLHLTCT